MAKQFITESELKNLAGKLKEYSNILDEAYAGSPGAQAIQKLNPDQIKDVNRITPGQVFKIPGKPDYTVVAGDTLDGIAKKLGVTGPAPAAPVAPAAPAAEPAAPAAPAAPVAPEDPRAQYDKFKADDAKAAAVEKVKQYTSIPLNQIPRLANAIDPKTGIIYYGEPTETGAQPKKMSLDFMSQPDQKSMMDTLTAAGLKVTPTPKGAGIFGEPGGYAMVNPTELAKVLAPTAAAAPAAAPAAAKESVIYRDADILARIVELAKK